MFIAAIAVGGFIGSILRYAVVELSLLLPFSGSLPWGTLFVNSTGCYLLGWFMTVIRSKAETVRNQWIRLGIGTGLLGSFTTFSAFSAESVQLIQTNQAGLALFYVMLSVFGGIGFTALGYQTARLQIQKRGRARL